MLKRPLVLGLIPLLAVGVWCTYRFGTLAGWWNPLTRPRNVSAGARHVFTWESSAWFDCNIDTKRDVNVCWAWDSYGRLLTAGDFRLRDENRAARKDELRPSITGPSNADGISDTIYLFGPNGLIMGRALVRIGDVGGAGQKRISQ